MAVMTKRDYYEVLGVARTASDAELKATFRKLAMKFHPDRNPGDNDSEHRFKEINEAYDVLKDADKRAAYDRFGHAGLQATGGAGGFNPDAFSDFGDILGDFFGFGDRFGSASGGKRRTRAQRGEDIRYDLELTFEEAVSGLSAEIAVAAIGRQIVHEAVNTEGHSAEPEVEADQSVSSELVGASRGYGRSAKVLESSASAYVNRRHIPQREAVDKARCERACLDIDVARFRLGRSVPTVTFDVPVRRDEGAEPAPIAVRISEVATQVPLAIEMRPRAETS